MAEALIQTLLDNANSLVQQEVRLLCGVENDVEKLTRTLSTIRDVLEDAEEKQQRDKEVEKWLRQLKDIAYEVDDILDEYATESSSLEYRRRSMNKIRAYLNIFNPMNVFFRHKIGGKMQQVQEKLDGISEERKKYNFQVGNVQVRADQVRSSRETSSILDVFEVYGRKEDQAKIVQCLVNDAANSGEVLVYPIVGMGGLGKTTLAKSVFNDEKIEGHFETRIWISVSQDFDIKKLMNVIAKSIDHNLPSDLSLDDLQRHLQKLLHGKMYLLVLDDVWDDIQEKWDKLKYTLKCGSKGSSILITTRQAKVGEIVGTSKAHDLCTLSEDDCWLLFKQHAFGNDMNRSLRFMEIAREIVKKCKGVPLAAKTLGSLMQFKDNVKQWLDVKESELWELQENEIMPALRLSYLNLPSKEKQCFAYCSIFPKNSTIETKLLIHLWMANGFISSRRKLEVEDVGDEICKELALRSLIQVSETDGSGDILSFKMHDLVHDLAKSIMKDECCVSGDGLATIVQEGTHHLSFYDDTYLGVNLKALDRVKSLRTFLLLPLPMYANIVDLDISKCHSLRSLVANSCNIKNLLPSIANVKSLRHLDLSDTCIETLPDSMCNLWNLLILSLENCTHLRALPKYLRRLINLRHFLLDGCRSLTFMPPKLGQMKGLKTLSLFIVDRRKGCGISELKSLNLAGRLCIKNLERVGGPMDAEEANLGRKENLNTLNLHWESDSERDNRRDENDREVLEALKPHPNIQELGIEGYQGARMPHWWSASVLDNIVSITLRALNNILQLPQLGRLPNLRDLVIKEMKKVKYLDDSNDEGTTAFPSLRMLRISSLPCLERLSTEEGREMFPSLTTVDVYDCPKLFSLPYLPVVTKLDVARCNKVLMTSIFTLNNLKELVIRLMSDEFRSFPDEMFTKLSALKSLEIVFCEGFESLPEQGLQGLKSLESLSIYGCPTFKFLSNGLQHLSALRTLSMIACSEVMDFPDVFQHLVCLRFITLNGGHWLNGRAGTNKLMALPEALKHVPNLEYLDIWKYDNWTSLPEWLGNLTSLQCLSISFCKNLSSLPTSIQRLDKLQTLLIQCCPKLTERYKQGIGEDWHLISHIPHVIIDD